VWAVNLLNTKEKNGKMTKNAEVFLLIPDFAV